MLRKQRLTHVQTIALGYFIMILLGTLLLMLPAASRSGESTGFLSCLFTATSASCVTGLVVKDTFTYWSLFGQLVIIMLIQIGGLGFMTISTFFFLFLRKKIGLRSREVMSESVNSSRVGEILGLTRKIILGTAIFECAGALALAFRFVPRFGLWKGLYFSVFHSISAFCNAGFDLMGGTAPYASMTEFSGDVLVNVTLLLLILIGGIGFAVWSDLAEKKWRIRRYSLHTKVVLVTTAVLVVIPALLFFLFERQVSSAGRSLGEQVLCALFNAVTPRTAGMSTVDLAQLSDSGKLLTTILMFIGGCPGSTAGGVKTVTVVVILAYVVSGLKGSTYVGMFGRRISEDSVRKAYTVVSVNLLLALFGTLCITASGLNLSDAILEAFSAISTVGLSTGITRDLNSVCRAVIILLMYCGRLGSVSFATALLEKRARPPVTAPYEELIIG
ncbi:MAG: TrkH family potassium uptake protein [Oscillospiraceae bacterium]|nr:TrkH family potassium uptake protein [Oscillospiraceae bacterium]